jgi:hypothetical protein
MPKNKSSSMEIFRENMEAVSDINSPVQKRLRAANYSSIMGLHLLVWFRHIDAHAYISKDVLSDAGVKSGVLGHWMREALRTWRELGFRVNDKGIPIFPLTSESPTSPVSTR